MYVPSKSSYGEEYFERVKNCIFKSTGLSAAQFDHCMFTNCQFIDCNLTEVVATETIFNECAFLRRTNFNNAIFELCHFLKPSFEGLTNTYLGSAVVINSKFSNYKKSIECEGEVFLFDIFDQINKLYRD